MRRASSRADWPAVGRCTRRCVARAPFCVVQLRAAVRTCRCSTRLSRELRLLADASRRAANGAEQVAFTRPVGNCALSLSRETRQSNRDRESFRSASSLPPLVTDRALLLPLASVLNCVSRLDGCVCLVQHGRPCPQPAAGARSIPGAR